MFATNPSPTPGSTASLVNARGRTADNEREGLIPRVCEVLRTIAQGWAAHRRSGGTPAIELVSETYVNVFGIEPMLRAPSRP